MAITNMKGYFRAKGSLSSLDQLPTVFTDRPEDFYRNEELAAAAAFAPNPDRPPFYGDYLFELREGHLVRNENAYERRMFIDWGEHEMEPLETRGLNFFAETQPFACGRTCENSSGG